MGALISLARKRVVHIHEGLFPSMIRFEPCIAFLLRITLIGAPNLVWTTSLACEVILTWLIWLMVTWKRSSSLAWVP